MAVTQRDPYPENHPANQPTIHIRPRPQAPKQPKK